ncbi:MAG: hypothetical protein JNM70_03960 [Anaerolineae bacterium]|nr:hypothetical protein [Anaerolineae bacterium]
MLDVIANWIAHLIMWFNGDWQPDSTALMALAVLGLVVLGLLWVIWKAMTRPIIQLAPMPPPPIEQPIPWIAIVVLLSVMCGVIGIIWFMPQV